VGWEACCGRDGVGGGVGGGVGSNDGVGVGGMTIVTGWTLMSRGRGGRSVFDIVGVCVYSTLISENTHQIILRALHPTT
jgi:hypothetical protein